MWFINNLHLKIFIIITTMFLPLKKKGTKYVQFFHIAVLKWLKITDLQEDKIQHLVNRQQMY